MIHATVVSGEVVIKKSLSDMLIVLKKFVTSTIVRIVFILLRPAPQGQGLWHWIQLLEF
jgi:hypothetical protein